MPFMKPMENYYIDPIQEAVDTQLSGFLNNETPRNVEWLIVDAIHRKSENFLIVKLNEMGFGQRQIAEWLGIKRNKVRAVIKRNL
jgi:hypothetical protein